MGSQRRKRKVAVFLDANISWRVYKHLGHLERLAYWISFSVPSEGKGWRRRRFAHERRRAKRFFSYLGNQNVLVLNGGAPVAMEDPDLMSYAAHLAEECFPECQCFFYSCDLGFLKGQRKSRRRRRTDVDEAQRACNREKIRSFKKRFVFVPIAPLVKGVECVRSVGEFIAADLLKQFEKLELFV